MDTAGAVLTTADADVTGIAAVAAGLVEAKDNDARLPQPAEPEANGGAEDDVTDAEFPLLTPECVGIPGRGAGRVWPKGGREGTGADAALTPTTLAELPCRLSLLVLLLPETSTEEEPVWLVVVDEEGIVVVRWSKEDAATLAEDGATTPCWAMISERSRSGSWTRPWISSCACLVASAEPRMRMVRSPWPLCFSTSMWAPDASRMAFMLQPHRPITRLMAVEGTVTFLERRTTSFQPSSPRW